MTAAGGVVVVVPVPGAVPSCLLQAVRAAAPISEAMSQADLFMDAP